MTHTTTSRITGIFDQIINCEIRSITLTFHQGHMINIGNSASFQFKLQGICALIKKSSQNIHLCIVLF